jgi:hypothetical protein
MVFGLVALQYTCTCILFAKEKKNLLDVEKYGQKTRKEGALQKKKKGRQVRYDD